MNSDIISLTGLPLASMQLLHAFMTIEASIPPAEGCAGKLAPFAIRIFPAPSMEPSSH